MVATSVLRELQHAEWAVVFVVDGIPHAWTDDAGLAQTSNWFGDNRTLHGGMVPPSRALAIQVFEGRLRSERMAVTILDTRAAFYTTAEDYLADLFKTLDDTAEAVALTLDPSTTAPAALFSKHVGTEAIGAAGQRRRYPFSNGWDIGEHHLGADWEHSEFPTADASDDPIVFRGRRCALYRVFRDHITEPTDRTAGWAPWATEAEILWWGTLADAGTVEGGKWTLEADGPKSLLEKQLATLSQSHGARISVPIVLDDSEGNDETGVGIAFYSIGTGSDSADTRYYSFQTYPASPFNLSTTHATSGDLADEIDALIQTVAADTTVGTDQDFIGQFENDAQMRTDGAIRIRCGNNKGTGGQARMAVMHLSLHEKVWTALGWTRDQGRISNPLELDPEFLVGLRESNELGFPTLYDNPADADTPPGPNYWTIIVATARQENIINDSEAEAVQSWDNDGQDQIYFPLLQGGASTLPSNLGHGLEIDVKPTTTYTHHSGQLDRPVASAVDDVTAPYDFGGANTADRQGVWFVVGPRRFAGEGQEFTDIQPVVASWVEGTIPGTVGPGIDSKLLLTKWLNPQDYGIPRLPMSEVGPWAVLQNDLNQVQVFPAFRLGYSEHSYERPERVLQRLLYSSGGSSGWSSYEGDPANTFDTTSNEPTSLITTNLDAEIADLGLAIPKALIDSPNNWAAEFEKLPSGGWRRFRMLIRPGFEVEQLFEELFKFYGLSWSLHGGKYGIRAVTETFTLEDVEVAITQSQKAVDPQRIGDERTRQELRVMQPINDFEVRFGWDPWEERFPSDGKVRLRANDRGARYRSRGHNYGADAYGIRSLQGWRERTTEIARFYEKRHFMLRGYPVKNRRPGQDIWPGTIVSITEPRAVSPTGTYGITTHVGIVTRVEEDLAVRGNGVAFRIDVLVQQDSAQTPRLCAPSARVLEYDTGGGGSGPFTLRVADNWLANEDGDWLDANGYVEPASSTSGGDIGIKCLSWDGNAWQESFTATVTNVNASSGDLSTLTLSAAITGTFYRDMLNIVVPRDFDNQGAAWVTTFLATIGDDAGEFGGTPSSKWHL